MLFGDKKRVTINHFLQTAIHFYTIVIGRLILLMRRVLLLVKKVGIIIFSPEKFQIRSIAVVILATRMLKSPAACVNERSYTKVAFTPLETIILRRTFRLQVLKGRHPSA